MYIRRTILALVFPALIVMTGCSSSQAVRPAPEDFSIRYDWAEGTMPPPHHYEYEIYIGPGDSGRIDYHPDYGNTPTWTERFAVGDTGRDSLYALLQNIDAFSRQWRPMQQPPIGGSVERFEATADGRTVATPFHLQDAGDRRDVNQVFAAVKSLVPKEVWTLLEERRKEYVESYQE